jgi:PIN domain nuclease of toxin-antitoxin system
LIVLLDTHALLWALHASPRSSANAREIIEDENNTVLVSVVSAWDIEVKRALGRLETSTSLLPRCLMHGERPRKRSPRRGFAMW